MKIAKVTDWKTAGWKLVSLVVSGKIQIWAVTTMLLIANLIGAGEWLTVTIIVLGGRIAKAYAERVVQPVQSAQPVQLDNEEPCIIFDPSGGHN